MKLSGYCLGAITLGIAVGAMMGVAQTPATQSSAATQAAEPIEVNLKDMSLFDFDPWKGGVDDIPQRFRDLEGKRVTFVGEMWAPAQRDDGSLSFFQTVYSKTKWSFRGPPHPQDFWDCNPVNGVKIDYSDWPVKVIGVFHVKIRRDEDIKSIYEVDVQSVRPFDGDFPPAPHDTTRPNF
jgi:hypothetical protein